MGHLLTFVGRSQTTQTPAADAATGRTSSNAPVAQAISGEKTKAPASAMKEA
jgi:hypothetical protein